MSNPIIHLSYHDKTKIDTASKIFIHIIYITPFRVVSSAVRYLCDLQSI